jgi:dipeptidase E
MKLLLSSNGLSNDSIATAFKELISKDPKDSKVAFIPTAANPERINKDWLIDDLYRIKEQGYWVDVIDLVAIKSADLRSALNNVDAIFVGGGNSFYLSYWMQKSGFFEIVPELLQTKVYAGISAGSMIAGSSLLESGGIKDGYIDEHYYDKSIKDEASDKTLNLVDIIFRPHLNSPSFAMVTEENLVKIAPKLHNLMYALDDQSALVIVEGEIKVVSEGKWKVFND